MSARVKGCGLSGVSLTLIAGLVIALASLAGVSAGSNAAAMVAVVPAPDVDMARAPQGLDLKAAAAAVLGREGRSQDEGKQLESMLHWAIQNSDSNVLRERAAEVQAGKGSSMSAEKLAAHKKRTQELIQLMKQPSETDLIKERLIILAAVESTIEERISALRDLQDLVAPLDNANDLKVLGMQPIIDALLEPALADSAASVIGVAAANNAKFQTDLLEVAPHIFDTLTKMMGLQQWRSAEKGLRCAAALVRNQEPLLSRFLDAGGCSAVQKLLTAAAAPSRLRSLALDLLTDLYPKSEQVRAELQSQDSCRAVLALINQPDRDLQERAVQALLVLLKGSPGMILHYQSAGGRETLTAAEMEMRSAISESAGDVEDKEWLESILVSLIDANVAISLQLDKNEL